MQKEIGERLKAVRLTLGHQVKEWAESLGQPASRIADVERGKTKAPHDLMTAVVQKFGVSGAWLMTGAGVMFSATDAATSDDLVNLLQRISLKLAEVDAASETKRRATQWLMAVETKDGKTLDRLASSGADKLVANEGDAPRYHKAERVSEHRLRRAIELCEEAIASEGVRPVPNKMAGLLCAVYEMGEGGAAVSIEMVRSLVRLAA